MEGDVLAGFELRQRPAIVGSEVKRVNVITFANFVNHLEFSAAIPDELNLLDFFEPGFSDLDFGFQALAGQRLLFALEGEAAKSSVAERSCVERQETEEQISEEQPEVSPQYKLRLMHKGLHF